MKTNEEMVASLLTRRDTYKKERKRTMKKWGTVAACACLVAVLGVGVWKMQPDAAAGEPVVDKGGVTDLDGAVIQYTAEKEEAAEQDIACLKEKGSFEVDGDQLGVLVYNHKKYMQSFIDVDREVVKGEYLGDTGDFEGNYYPGDGQVYLLKDYPDTLYIELTNGGHVFLTVYDGGEPVPKKEDVAADRYGQYLEQIKRRQWPSWYGGSFLDGGKLYVYVTEETDEVRAEAYEMFGECELLWGKYEYEYLNMLIAEISSGMTDGKLPTVSSVGLLDGENCVEVCFSRESPEAQKQIERMDDVGGAIRFRVVSGTTLAYTEDVEAK